MIAQSFLHRLLFVSTGVVLLAAGGCVRYQTPATLSEEEQQDAPPPVVTVSLQDTPAPLRTLALPKASVPARPFAPPRTSPAPPRMSAPRHASLPWQGPVRRMPAIDVSRAFAPTAVNPSFVRLASATQTSGFNGGARRIEFAQPRSIRQVARRLTTLHLNDVEVRQALDMLGRTHGVNILIASGVKGKVTANLEGLSFDSSLNAILKLSHLVADHEDGMIFVYAQEDYLDDIRVQSFPLDYVSVEQMLPVVQNFLSTNGSVVAVAADPKDNRKTTESIVVTDKPTVLARVAQYLKQVDVPPLQVMIEAHILQITLSDDLRHGINYKHAMSVIAGNSFELDITGFADATSSPAVFARLSSADVNGLLDLLKTTTDAKTLASPRLMVINGQTARLQVGDQLPYKVVTVTETAAVEEVKFLDVGIVLEVTPRISRDGRILMHVKPQVSDGTFDPESGLPGEETREVESDVLLADGQGMVIGGLIQEQYSDVQTKLPVLGDLPWIGRLFQKRERIKERTELVITLIPHIIPLDGPQSDRDVIDRERAQSELFYGPLCRLPRPWEPTLPDAINQPRRLWVGIQNELGDGCWRCGSNRNCACQDPVLPEGVYEPLEAPLDPTDRSANEGLLMPTAQPARFVVPPPVVFDSSP